MKILITFVALVASLQLLSQTKTTCSCVKEISCKDSLLSFLKWQTISPADKKVNAGYDTYYLTNGAGDSLVLTYYQKFSAQGSVFKLAKITGSYTAVEAVYKNWFGRKTDFAKVKAAGTDYWQLQKLSFQLTKHRFDDYWQIEIY